MRHLGHASSEHQKFEKRAKAIEQNFINLIICPCQCCRFVLSPYVGKKWKNIMTELPSVDLYTYTHNAARKEQNTWLENVIIQSRSHTPQTKTISINHQRQQSGRSDLTHFHSSLFPPRLKSDCHHTAMCIYLTKIHRKSDLSRSAIYISVMCNVFFFS